MDYGDGLMPSDQNVTLFGVAIATTLAAAIVFRRELWGFMRKHRAALVDVAAGLAIAGVLTFAPFIARGPTGLTYECRPAPVVSPPTRGPVICEVNLQQLAIRLGLVIVLWAVIRLRGFR